LVSVSQYVVPCQTGVELVEEYQKLLGKCNRKKSDLVNAENLFNLPMTSYPILQVRVPSLRLTPFVRCGSTH
jgi:hypothetical protein